ncbi:hypothetical protein G4B88_001910 [Cannabis sativa]|uniref:Cytochrome P450 n=1 Tax=Cannabis sativa TaxID=3483 RepID=A0A7J6HCV5_CANSA|nr:hypothetical protein G4B88_001910 [Cannabis sativa]
MDPFLQIVISCLLPLLLIFICYHLKKSSSSSSSTNSGPILAPEAAGAWPIIGHLHLFGGKNLTHKTLGAMADKGGPIFTIKLGSHKVVVVNNGEIAKDCLTTHDMAFSTRPTIVASKLLGYNYAMFGFAPYGDYWREMRKIATVELLSNQRLDLLKHIWSSEVETWASELYNKLCLEKGSEKNRVLVDMKRWFGDLTGNISVRMIGGKRCFGENNSTKSGFGEEESIRCRNVMRDFAYLFGVFVLADAIPFLGWWDINGYKKAMKKTASELDVLIAGWLEEHKQKRKWFGEKGNNGNNNNNNSNEEKDFMDVMLNILDGANVDGVDADTINKATCLAIIKETIRLYPPSPLLLRATKEDCTLTCGYHVRKGTRLMVNTWKIQREERVWGHNSEEFEPERFLTSHKEVDLRGKLGFEMVSFGGGRRSCPGVSLALRMVHLGLARFLHGFEVSKKLDNEEVDMTETTGLTNLRATPLEVFLTPRPILAPEAAGAWPIIGHLHLFGDKNLTHKTLGAMADKDGPIFTIKLGSHKVVVVNNGEIAKDCFTTHDMAFSTRPTIVASKLLGYNYAMFGFAPYGAYWREMRKIATVELLSNKRLDLLKHIWSSEVDTWASELYNKLCLEKGSEKNRVLVDMKRWFGHLTGNISVRLIGGKRCFGENNSTKSGFGEEESVRCRKVMRDFSYLFGVFVLADAIPFLGWWDVNGYKKAMKKTASELDVLIAGWLEEHKHKRKLFGKKGNNGNNNSNEEKDFMDVMLNILDGANVDGVDADTINKATCLQTLDSQFEKISSMLEQHFKTINDQFDQLYVAAQSTLKSTPVNMEEFVDVEELTEGHVVPSAVDSMDDSSVDPIGIIRDGCDALLRLNRKGDASGMFVDRKMVLREIVLGVNGGSPWESIHTPLKDRRWIFDRGRQWIFDRRRRTNFDEDEQSRKVIGGRREAWSRRIAESAMANRVDDNPSNLMLPASDTTMIALTWALSLLLNNPNKLQKAQLELDQIVGRERNVEESDIQNLIYLQAIIKETIRLYPPSPLLLRATKEDCTLTCGYHVRKGTRLMVNAWKIQREEGVWGHNSEEFEPERFLTSHKEVDLRGKLGFEIVSFGGGRRSCPGVSLALRMVHLGLARFLHGFEVSKKLDNEEVDMTETTGLTNSRATPLEVFLTPRLHSKLYE